MNKQDNTEVFKRGFKPKIGEFVVVTDDIPNVDKGSILKVRRVVHGVDSIVLTDDNLYAYARSEHIRPLRPDEVANAEHAEQFVGRKARDPRGGTVYVLGKWCGTSWVVGPGSLMPRQFRNDYKFGSFELLPLDHEAEQVETFAGGWKVGDRGIDGYGDPFEVITEAELVHKRKTILKAGFVPVRFNDSDDDVCQMRIAHLHRLDEDAKPEAKAKPEPESTNSWVTPSDQQGWEARVKTPEIGHHKKRKEWYDFLDSLCVSADGPSKPRPTGYNYQVALSQNISEDAIINEWKVRGG